MATEKTKNLYESLASAQADFHSAIKKGENPHFKKSYADLSNVWEACKDGLAKNGLFVSQTPDLLENGSWVLFTRIFNGDGEFIQGKTPIIVSRPNDPQAFGSAMTYARRYGLASTLGIVTEDDDGEGAMDRSSTKSNNKAAPAPQKKEDPKYATQDQKDGIMKTISNPVFTKDERDAIIGQLNNYTQEQAEKNHAGLKARIEKRVNEKMEASKELIEFLNQNKELIPADQTKEYYDLINDPKVQAAEILKAKEVLVDSLANA